MIKIFNNFTGAYFTIPITSKYLTSKEIKYLLNININIKDSYYFIMLDDQKIYSNVFDIKDNLDKIHDCSNGLEFYIINTIFIHNEEDYIKKILHSRKNWNYYNEIFKQLYDDNSDLLNNMNFIIFCSIHTTVIFTYMSSNLKNDKKFIIELINYNHRIINYISKELFRELKELKIFKFKYIEYPRPAPCKALRMPTKNFFLS
jgi:hypothetical protein